MSLQILFQINCGLFDVVFATCVFNKFEPQFELAPTQWNHAQTDMYLLSISDMVGCQKIVK